MTLALVVVSFALACGLLAAAHLSGRLGLVAAVLLAVSLLGWMAAVAAIVTGAGDADGFAGCGGDCSGVQLATGVGFLSGPLLVALAGAALLFVLADRARRRRRA